MYGGPGLLKAGHDLNVPGPAAYSKHQHVGGDKPAFSFGPGDLIIKQKDGRVVNKSKTLHRYGVGVLLTLWFAWWEYVF